MKRRRADFALLWQAALVLFPALLLPGVAINTTPADYRPIKQLQLERFDGTRYVRFGEVMSAD